MRIGANVPQSTLGSRTNLSISLVFPPLPIHAPASEKRRRDRDSFGEIDGGLTGEEIAKDVVCGMQVEEKKAWSGSCNKGLPTTSVPPNANRRSTVCPKSPPGQQPDSIDRESLFDGVESPVRHTGRMISQLEGGDRHESTKH